MSTAAISSNPSLTPKAEAPKSKSGATPAKASTAPANSSASATAAVSAAVAALKEVTETSAQTTNEAAHGDRQAQKLLTKEAAAAAARTGAAPANRSTVSGKGASVNVKA